MSPESSIGGHSDHHFPTYPAAAAVPLSNSQHCFITDAQQSFSPSYPAAAVPLASDQHCFATDAQQPYTTAYGQAAQQHQTPALAVPKPRAQLPDLNSSQPGPIEIDTSLLYTPQSGNSSADVSQSGGQLDGEQSVNSHESHWRQQVHGQDVHEAESVRMPDDEAGTGSSGRQGFSSQHTKQGSQQRAVSAPRNRAGTKQTVSR